MIDGLWLLGREESNLDKGVAPSMLNKQAGYGSAPKLYSINWTYYLLFKKKRGRRFKVERE